MTAFFLLATTRVTRSLNSMTKVTGVPTGFRLRSISDNLSEIYCSIFAVANLGIDQEHLNKAKSSIIEVWHSRCSVVSPRREAVRLSILWASLEDSKKKNDEEGSGI